jgi:hypothetical protein
MPKSTHLFLLLAVLLNQILGNCLPAKVFASTAAAEAIPVQKVVLYSSGVGYFEHLGMVRGDASTVLPFKTAQISDVLKSLVLQDLDGGTIRTVTYPSQDPLEKTLASFQVDLTGNPSLAELLNQVRGAKVVGVAAGGEEIAGTVIGVEAQQRPSGGDGEPITVFLLNVLAGPVISSVELGQLRRLELEDSRLQEELERALAAVAQARGRDTKPVVVHFGGEGERRVRMGYVIETPIWKTSYRLVLPETDDGKAILQGWAIVENQTDTDWRDVQLSLVSGRPISFVQDLYQPLYLRRPVVVSELHADLVPQEYAEGFHGEMVAPVLAAPMAMADSPVLQRTVSQKEDGGRFGTLAGAGMLDAEASVSAAASASQLGELFQYTVGHPVTLARQRSAMLPILNDPVAVERVSIFNAAVLPRNPLTGALLNNTSGKHLLQGPVTVLEAGAYAGDARLNDVPPGQRRLLSYGIDLQVLVESGRATSEGTIEAGKIVRGVMQLVRKRLSRQEYRIQNRAERDRLVVVEHPLRPGWMLVSPEKAEETTDQFYRFRLPVAAGAHTTLTVEEERRQEEKLAILPMDLTQVTSYARDVAIPRELRDGLAEAAKRKQATAVFQRQLDQTVSKAQDVAQAQQRTRDNMQAIDSQVRQGEYYHRLLQRLADQDAELDRLQRQAEELQGKVNAAEQDLVEYLTSLDVG